MITTSIISTTIIDLRKMANDSNGYNNALPHPMTSTITFISRRGRQVSILVGQLATITAIINEYESVGRAIDHLFSQIPHEKVNEICDEF